ncbi:MAG: hypothetical protein GYA47_10995 [Desulfovibrio sp.]|nr:hypothetical protein [Desulfovibrio sp.]
MSMVAFVSFASDTAREQELLSSVAIGAFACDHARDIIRRTDGLRYGKVLAGHRYPFLIGRDDAAYALLPPGDRSRGERDRILEAGEGTRSWRIVLRPLQGRVSWARLRSFCQELAGLAAGEASGSAPRYGRVVSVVPYCAGSHPLWGSVATHHANHDRTSVRMTNRGGGHEKRGRDIFEAGPDDLGTARPTGSQHVRELYYDDQALWAFRDAGDAEPWDDAAPPHPVFVGEEAYWDFAHPFFQLPIFEMSPDCALDIRNVEKVAGCVCRGASRR